MGRNMQERCMSCMKLLNWDGRCPNCGFDKSKYLFDSHYLPMGTLLKNGDYMVGKVLGEGGFGITYIGFDQNLLSRVAIKEYYPTGFAGRDISDGNYELRVYGGDADNDYQKGLEAFLEEARILAKFSGMEGIVNVRSLFQENGTAYIVMEYVDGISVKNYIQKHGRIKPELVLEMMEQPIRALRAIHEEQLVHRDVSADNFMISQDGKVTLIDFGAARYSNVMDERTRTTICKQGFSALEQYSRDGKQGPWTDVYSICATMYYMLTGIVPKNSTERIVDDEVVPLDQMTELKLGIEKKRSIMTGMAVKSNDRFQNMEVLYLAIYGKPLNVNTRNYNIFSGEEVQEVPAVKQSFSNNAVSPTGLLQELWQASATRKSRARRERIGKITKGAVAAVLLLLILWSMKGYIGFDESDPNKENKKNQMEDVKKESVHTPNLSEQQDNSQVQKGSEETGTSGETAAKMVKMPKVEGSKRAVAIDAIKKSGLTYRVVSRYSNSIAKGMVIRASVSEGVYVKKGKKIIIYISKGKKIKQVKVSSEAIVTREPVQKRQEKSTETKKKEDDNLAGDLDSIIY